MPTLLIDNFSAALTRKDSGDINSGLAKFNTTFGADPFSDPGNLKWMETPVSLSQGGLTVAARPRLESGITYVYILKGNVITGTSAILDKIQVNDPASMNPNYDNLSFIANLPTNSPTIKFGSSLQFYGATEKIYAGHDLGVTSINFDGTGETFVGTLGSYTANVPRPSANFLGKLYFGNGSNILEIDSTETVTTYAKLSPGFPVGTYVRDLDVSPDGNYLQIIVSHINSPNLATNNQDTTSLSSTDSYKFLWNGTDTGYTSYESFSGFAITSNITFGQYSYTMGYDLGGAAIYEGGEKIISLPTSLSPNFEAMFSTGNLLGFGSSDYNFNINKLSGSIFVYGQYDNETPKGLYRLLRFNATGDGTLELIQMPVCIPVSNLFYGSSSSGYTNNVVGEAKLYFSTLGKNGGSDIERFNLVPTGSGTAITGVYETQNELFSKKVKPTQVRFYTKPLVANNSFTIDLIGSDGNPISGGSKTFTVGSGPTLAGQDFLWYTPQTAPTYTLGARISNLGTANWTGVKLEIDYEAAGQ